MAIHRRQLGRCRSDNSRATRRRYVTPRINSRDATSRRPHQTHVSYYAVVAVLIALSAASGGGGGAGIGFGVVGVGALEARWTPADDAQGGNGGPLPLSQNHRDQLTRLDQAISGSPNPSATLAHMARQKDMLPQDLADLLTRNRQDMEMAGGGRWGGGRSGMTLSKRVLDTVTAPMRSLIRVVRSHPLVTGLATIAVISLVVGDN